MKAQPLIAMVLCALGTSRSHAIEAQQKTVPKVTPKAQTASKTAARVPQRTAAKVPSRVVTQAVKTQKERVSYSIGLDIGQSFKNQQIDIDPTVLLKGIQDAVSGGKRLLTEKEIAECMNVFRRR